MHAGREAIALMATGVALIFLTTAFFLTKRNVDLGRDYLNSAVQMTDNASAQVINESFGEIINQPKKMPASGAFALINYNLSHINSITCYICNPSGQRFTSIGDSCFQKHVTGEVSIWAEKEYKEGKYDLFVSSEINSLTHGEKLMSLADIQTLLHANKNYISNVVCGSCGRTYIDIETCCLFDTTHAKVKSMRVSTLYNNGTKKYTVYIGE